MVVNQSEHSEEAKKIELWREKFVNCIWRMKQSKKIAIKLIISSTIMSVTITYKHTTHFKL